jgi:hypothetical protein
MTSPDGITWTARTAAQANSWRSITHGNGLFVAVSYDGSNRVMTSADILFLNGGSSRDSGKVGDVMHSMLTEEQFIAENGSGWILADGRSVVGTRYHTITGNANIPDARGRYLRPGGWAGMNLGDMQEATRVISIAENGTTGTASDIYASRNRSVQPEAFDPDPNGSLNEEGISTFGRHFITTTIDAANDRRGVVRTRPRSLVVNAFIKIEDIGL